MRSQLKFTDAPEAIQQLSRENIDVSLHLVRLFQNSIPSPLHAKTVAFTHEVDKKSLVDPLFDYFHQERKENSKLPDQADWEVQLTCPPEHLSRGHLMPATQLIGENVLPSSSENSGELMRNSSIPQKIINEELIDSSENRHSSQNELMRNFAINEESTRINEELSHSSEKPLTKKRGRRFSGGCLRSYMKKGAGPYWEWLGRGLYVYFGKDPLSASSFDKLRTIERGEEVKAFVKAHSSTILEAIAQGKPLAERLELHPEGEEVVTQ